MGVPYPIFMALPEYDCQDRKKTVRLMEYPTKWSTHAHLKCKYDVLLS